MAGVDGLRVRPAGRLHLDETWLHHSVAEVVLDAFPKTFRGQPRFGFVPISRDNPINDDVDLGLYVTLANRWDEAAIRKLFTPDGKEPLEGFAERAAEGLDGLGGYRSIRLQ